LMAGVASAAVTGVTGKPEGFASSTTGGGDATAVYPSTTDELVSYLGDNSARVIVLTKTFDFTGTEGTTTSSGCAPCELIFKYLVRKTDRVLILQCRGYCHWMPNCNAMICSRSSKNLRY
jgi:pectate lyase